MGHRSPGGGSKVKVSKRTEEARSSNSSPALCAVRAVSQGVGGRHGAMTHCLSPPGTVQRWDDVAKDE